MQDEEREAAEQYRQDRQAADAQKSGFSYPNPTDVYQWMDKNREKVLGIAIANGVSEEKAPALIELYKTTIKRTPVGSPLDDLHARTILKGIIDRVEEVCKALRVQIRSGVVFGIAPEMGVVATQTSVMMTDVSILSFSLHFVTFCNLISKVLARTLIHEPGPVSPEPQVKVCFDPMQIRARLQASPELQAEWASILIHFASFGAPGRPTPAPERAGQLTRFLILKAMEEFAVAHEYGHHVLAHGLSESSEDQGNHFQDEQEADLFARVVCMVLGGQDDPFNFYASSGVGGVVMLGMLDLVRRTRATLESGNDATEPRKRHPPYPNRIAKFDSVDPPNAAADYKQMRNDFAEIVELVWGAVKPVAISFYDSGYRPPPQRSVSEGWLPLH
ncbi:hypothetical protein WN73_18010 [Bradyrhizobium sp. CCBAU 45394]|uniref:ImmA/IrrE family metallo-endopeptidase n=1 Tax=Bradyrhizobium sp. CCBAU 45394 TaxID=1325087 RepID=UPI002303975F|nr:hypothetical protein [Bradyrhizobium sp. CCBAU 45394]MDA9392446.1 hypothetical protein [Bradyrhizobium sp. CCBAU 45394]